MQLNINKQFSFKETVIFKSKGKLQKMKKNCEILDGKNFKIYKVDIHVYDPVQPKPIPQDK